MLFNPLHTFDHNFIKKYVLTFNVAIFNNENSTQFLLLFNPHLTLKKKNNKYYPCVKIYAYGISMYFV